MAESSFLTAYLAEASRLRWLVSSSFRIKLSPVGLYVLRLLSDVATTPRDPTPSLRYMGSIFIKLGK